MEIAGKVAVVTGGASGIGRATARALASRGACVVIADIHEQRLRDTVAELESTGSPALGVRCDVRSEEEILNLAAQTQERFGHTDILMNNAGVAAVGPTIETITVGEWQELIDINFLSVVRCLRVFLPDMLERRSGWIINTASVASFYVHTDHQGPYSATKFAVRGLTEGLYHSVTRRGVGVSCLCPNAVATSIGEGVRLLGSDDWSIVQKPDLREITAEEAALAVIAGLEAERYLILTHPEEAAEIATRYADMDRALAAQLANSIP